MYIYLNVYTCIHDVLYDNLFQNILNPWILCKPPHAPHRLGPGTLVETTLGWDTNPARGLLNKGNTLLSFHQTLLKYRRMAVGK